MMFLVQEETTIYTMGFHTRIEVKGYYECDNEEEVKKFCKDKTEEIKSTYDNDRMDKTYTYKRIEKLNDESQN